MDGSSKAVADTDLGGLFDIGLPGGSTIALPHNLSSWPEGLRGPRQSPVLRLKGWSNLLSEHGPKRHSIPYPGTHS